MDEKRLVKDCLRCLPAAQRELYDLFAPQMMAVCYRYTKSVNDAEDVLQEGFIKVYKNLHQYRFDGELGAWIRAIMVRTSLNYLKKNQPYSYEFTYDDVSMHPVEEATPLVVLNAKELADMIRQLPTGYQAIFNLHAVEGYTHVEIGKMLGIHEGTSRSQYMRARTLLTSWLEHKSSVGVKKERYAGK
ncbi:RNA polymerase sigma factor [Panacibacter sp. DH6]|uniref:RNA polymerase sigma factor n=1 Tax=Panacibacter microcysteis TaxID=2793269 RepID=A0A931E2Y2_9BACT|nr:RNA polymerase sigma factor [Panacibacter microcysteis]MBG9377617.1 RNA polymerase sigma factor [Panacibacter microcysteis]